MYIRTLETVPDAILRCFSIGGAIDAAEGRYCLVGETMRQVAGGGIRLVGHDI